MKQVHPVPVNDLPSSESGGALAESEGSDSLMRLKGTAMSGDARNLILVLDGFLQDIRQCLGHESQDFLVSDPGGDGGQATVSDPILLGDFIVEAYNGYLAKASEISDNPMVQAMRPIARLESTAAMEPDDSTDERPRRPRQHGGDPRIGKMTEVATAANQLLTLLRASVEAETGGTSDALDTVMALLESLGEQGQGLPRGPGFSPGEWGPLGPMIDAYNRYLAHVMGQVDDPTLGHLFRPIDSIDVDALDGKEAVHAAFGAKLAEVNIARTSLASYLKRRLSRAK